MSHHVLRLCPCRSLSNLCLSTLEKCLLRAFYITAKRECKNSPEHVLVGVDCQSAITMLCEKNRLSPVEEIRSYLFPKLPSCYRQDLVDSLMNAMVSPEFDESMLLNSIEFKFKSCDTVVDTSNMNQIIQCYLKCMLVGYVTKLDFGELYAMESCWVARSRRILHTWSSVKGNGSQFVEGIEEGMVDTKSVESLWKDLIFDNGRAVSEGAVASSSYFCQLVSINIDFVATGQLVWSIGCNCPLLQDLSLYVDTTDRNRYSIHFEDDLMNSLSALYAHKVYTITSFRRRPLGCPKIRKIVLPSVEAQEKLEVCTAKLLCYLSRLKEVINVCTTGAFAALLNEEDFKNKPLSLTVIDEARSENTIEDVCRQFDLQIEYFFPKVTNVRILQSKYPGGLRMLSSFPGLKNLEVVSSDETELEFGINFTRITHFKSNCKWDEKKLAGFSKRAPKLEVFFSFSGSLHRHKKSRDTISFPVLRIIKMYQLIYIDPEPFISLIKGTKVLTHIFLEDDERTYDFSHSIFSVVNDKVISSVMPSLKKLIVFQARTKKFCGRCRYAMTMKSVNNFLHGCPDLRGIGNLFHWDIPYHDVLVLKKQAKEKNWDIHLSPSDSF